MTPSCSGNACNQGRTKCSTPEACLLPVEDDLKERKDIWEARLIAALCLLALLAALSPVFA